MTNATQILAIIEPTLAGEAPLTVAADATASGGGATVLVHITEQVRRDIRDFARSEDLGLGEAEGIALARLVGGYKARLGDRADVQLVFAAPTTDALIRVAHDVGASMVAVTAQFGTTNSLSRLVEAAHVPVMIVPARTCVPA